MERGPLGFFPGLRTPTGRTCGARQGGDGHRALARSYATDILSALQSASSLAMCDFRVAAEVSNLSLSNGICTCFRFKGPPAHVCTPFRAGHQARYPASYPPTTREEFPVVRSTVSCCLSAAGVRFLGTLSYQTEFRPHCCRPTAPAAHTRAPTTDPGRVSTFRTRETRTGPGALCTPGTAVFTGHRHFRGRRPPPHNGWSLAPRHSYPTRDDLFTRHRQEFPGSRPVPVLPLACDRHGWDSSPWTFP
jgi:hypothetical protein